MTLHVPDCPDKRWEDPDYDDPPLTIWERVAYGCAWAAAIALGVFVWSWFFLILGEKLARIANLFGLF